MIYALPVLVGFLQPSHAPAPTPWQEHCSIYVFAFKSIPHQFRIAASQQEQQFVSCLSTRLDCIAIYLHNFVAAGAAEMKTTTEN